MLSFAIYKKSNIVNK